jgi:hypothetical protein
MSANLDSYSENSQDNDETVAVSMEFQESVIKFVKLDDLMKKKQKELTELRNQRKPCEEFILKYLDQIDETVVEITTGKLRKNKSETKVPLNKEVIKQAIQLKVKNKDDVDFIMKQMDELRPINTRENIKRTNNRGPRKATKPATKPAT